MTKKPSKPKELAPWNRRPWPKRGNKSQPKLYASVGRVLSQWERYEGLLSLLFSAFVAQAKSNAAQRSFGAIRTSEGRIEMLRAASESYFIDNPDDELLKQFKSILTSSTRFASCRNDIAHGVVSNFIPKAEQKTPRIPTRGSYALYPTYTSFRERNLSNEATYCYTSAELDYYFTCFWNLQNPVISLTNAILKKAQVARRKPFRNKLYVPIPSLANLPFPEKLKL
ncbi:MAG: hypothetical protein ACLP1W_20625 [Rhodomicrobium sp.]